MLVVYFLKTKKEFKNNMQAENANYIYGNDLDKASIQHDMAYGK